MGACCCSLAGTEACKNCPNNGNNIDFYPKWLPNYASYVYDNYLTKEQLDSITTKEDKWEIPSFMNKGDSNDS